MSKNLCPSAEKEKQILLMISGRREFLLMISGRREFGREGEERSERRRLPVVSSAARRISCAYIGRPSSRTLYASLAFLGKKKRGRGTRDTKREDTSFKKLIIFHWQKGSTPPKKFKRLNHLKKKKRKLKKRSVVGSQ